MIRDSVRADRRREKILGNRCQLNCRKKSSSQDGEMSYTIVSRLACSDSVYPNLSGTAEARGFCHTMRSMWSS